MSAGELVARLSRPQGRGSATHLSSLAVCTRGSGIAQLKVTVLETVSITPPNSDVPVPICALQQKVMLTLLVAYANRSIPVDRIADELWGEHRPGRWEAAVRTLANSLRRTAGDRNLVHWTGRGYRLHREDGAVETDIDAMAAAAEGARIAIAEERFADAEQSARRAIAHYGGGPWTTDVWCWADLAADAYHLLGQALLAQEQYVACLMELRRAPEELGGHEGLDACIRWAEQAARRRLGVPDGGPHGTRGTAMCLGYAGQERGRARRSPT